ncbi:MAG: cyclopropane fatty acyl phospholipid synthase [Bacteroidales bacterium]|nr:cyclopropane fatty acyl phospholipid synthase [Bacteroidales bacterium]
MTPEKFIRSLLKDAEITVAGDKPWDIQVHDQRMYKRVLNGGMLAVGESYMDGWWDTPSLDEFINRVLRAKLDRKIKGDWKTILFLLRSKMFNMQTRGRSRKVGEEHYDLGNDLYRRMLDKRMNYTCAYWKNAKTLDEAQEAKLDLVCRKTELKPGMKVLELGCGWGSFAKYAAEKYGVHVTAYNISEEQVKLARELTRGLEVEILQKDYREAEGKYDAVISIGIMEHVGYKNYHTYMEITDRCLKEDGVALIHTIGGNISTTHTNPWTDKYIFPNGMLPSVAQLSEAMEGLFVIEDLHNFGPDYDKTLMAWFGNFDKSWPELKDKYGERFYRMWKFYLLSAAGGFRSRSNQLWQIVMTRPGRQQPPRIC